MKQASIIFLLLQLLFRLKREEAAFIKNGFMLCGLFFAVGCYQYSQLQSSSLVLPLKGSHLSLEQVEDAYTLAYDTQFDDGFVIGVGFEYRGEPTGRSYILWVHKGDEVWLRVWGTSRQKESYIILDRHFSSLEYAFQIGESLVKTPSPYGYEEQMREKEILEGMTERKLAEFLGITIKEYRSGRSRSRSRSRSRRTAKNREENLKKYNILLKETNNPRPFKVEILAEGLGTPWGMVFLNTKELLWTEREGAIKKIYIPTGQITRITGGPEVYSNGQGGLLDVALHPNFQRNKYIYFTYSLQQQRKSSTALARGRLEGNRITNLRTLFTAEPFATNSLHFGSRLAFDRNGFLFMTVGERKDMAQAQNLNSHLGKLLRLTDEGRSASGNPFTNTEGAKPEIWTLGHRNAQGLFIHPETQELYLQEHGPKGGDEINLIKKGANYGWPVITYGQDHSGNQIGEGTHKEGMEQPLKYWTPSIAPGGLLIYSGKKFPEWRGDFFSGALALRHLNRLRINNKRVVSEEELLSSFNFRFRQVIEDPQGFIYVSVDRGMILKISPL